VRSLLLKFWLFPIFGLFWAAGAAIDPGAGSGGGGDDGANGGGDGAGGGGSADDGAGADAGEGDQNDQGDVSGQSNVDADGTAGDNADGADPDAPVDLGDGRTVPSKWKKLFDQAAKAGLGKEAKQLYFAQQRLAKVIPGGVNAAIQLAKDVEEIGGVDGIRQLQDDIAVYQQDAEAFESNPAQWVETGFQENPDAALKSFAHSLDYVAEHHPEHYDHLMAKVIVNDLSNLDVRAMYTALKSLKDNPEAQKLAQQLAEYYNSRLETSNKVPEKKIDAAAKKLTEREKAIEKREMETRYSDVNRDAFPALKASVNKVLAAEAKKIGIDLAKLSKEYPGEWRDALNDIHKRVMQGAIKDTRFIDKYFALVKANDLKRALKAINEKHDQLVPDAVRAALAERGLFRGKKKPNATSDKGNQNSGGSGNATQGWLKVSKRPENSAINWSKTTQAMQLDGKYILKDGKKVVVQY
jgi:hypothetical protein